MAKCRIVTSVLAKKHLEQIYKSGRTSDIKKIELLFLELSEEPRKGTGKPERLKNYEGEIWSRRINQKDRLVYEIFEEEILVNIIRALGHYEDK